MDIRAFMRVVPRGWESLFAMGLVGLGATRMRTLGRRRSVGLGLTHMLCTANGSHAMRHLMLALEIFQSW